MESCWRSNVSLTVIAYSYGPKLVHTHVRRIITIRTMNIKDYHYEHKDLYQKEMYICPFGLLVMYM